MMDETTDISGNEQATIIIWFVDNEDSETLFMLTLLNIRGQCYDGASNMSGEYRGLQARIKDEAPKALYVHCYAHSLP